MRVLLFNISNASSGLLLGPDDPSHDLWQSPLKIMIVQITTGGHHYNCYIVNHELFNVGLPLNIIIN